MSVRTDLPAPVLALIEQSFNDRMTKVPNSGVVKINRPMPAPWTNKAQNFLANKIDNIVVKSGDYSGGNLDNAFETAPTSLDDLLERCMSIRDLSNITKIFERCRLVTAGSKVTTDAIWDGLRWVRRGWSTSSYGFDFSYNDRVLQRQLYDQLVLEKRLVRDTPRTGAEHPGCSTWREVPTRNILPTEVPRQLPSRDNDTLHLLIGDASIPGVLLTDQERLDQLHVDYASPCKTVSVDICELNVAGLAKHGIQVFKNIGLPTNPFTFPDVDVEVQTADLNGFLDKASSSKAATLRAEFAKFGRTWACQGYSGDTEAQLRFDQLIEIRDAVDRDNFIRALLSGAAVVTP